MIFKAALFDEGAFQYLTYRKSSNLGAYFIFNTFGWGAIRGGLIRERTYKIKVDIKKPLIKDLVYFSRIFLMNNYEQEEGPY